MQSQLCRFPFELTLVGILERFRRPHDQIQERAEEWKQGHCGRTADKRGIDDPATRIDVGPIDQREVNQDAEDDGNIDGDRHTAAFKPKIR
jgi:hypothetical protein